MDLPRELRDIVYEMYWQQHFIDCINAPTLAHSLQLHQRLRIFGTSHQVKEEAEEVRASQPSRLLSRANIVH